MWKEFDHLWKKHVDFCLARERVQAGWTLLHKREERERDLFQPRFSFGGRHGLCLCSPKGVTVALGQCPCGLAF